LTLKKLEKRLKILFIIYNFYDIMDFQFLFDDICKKEYIDNSYVNLNVGFQSALTFELIKLQFRIVGMLDL